MSELENCAEAFAKVIKKLVKMLLLVCTFRPFTIKSYLLDPLIEHILRSGAIFKVEKSQN